MNERYISVTDDEYVYFLDTESEDYKTLEYFEKKEFETAKKDNINIEEYEDAILQSASDKYWVYVYEYHVEADVVCDRLNEQDKRIKELTEENEQLKQENQRMTDKLNQLALEFLNYNMVTMGKATEISEMSYYHFLKYRKEHGNPMELQL